VALNREAAALAIFNRLQTFCGAVFVTYSRVYVDPTTLSPEKQPALMLIAERYNLQAKVMRGEPNVWLLYFSVLIYCRELESDPSPETQVNMLIDLVENSMAKQQLEAVIDNSNPTDTTLGGIVDRVSLRSWTPTAGIELMASSDSGQSAAIIPLEVLISGRSILGGG